MFVAEPIRSPPFPLNTMNVMTPFCFKDWLRKQKPALVSGQPLNMFGTQFETEVELCCVNCFVSSARFVAGSLF